MLLEYELNDYVLLDEKEKALIILLKKELFNKTKAKWYFPQKGSNCNQQIIVKILGNKRWMGGAPSGHVSANRVIH